MIGTSLGGLTSCYAAFKYPQIFQRALCFSPFVVWNQGELGRLITASSPLKTAPKSVVIVVGSAEMFINLTGILVSTQYSALDLVRQTYDAFALTPSIALAGYIDIGGFHAPTSWYKRMKFINICKMMHGGCVYLHGDDVLGTARCRRCSAYSIMCQMPPRWTALFP
jgi:hypothetical protein